MNNGKQNEPTLEKSEDNIPTTHLQFIRWLFKNQQVIEVWSLDSDLPFIVTPESAVTLDAGIWYFCRVALPPIPEDTGISRFIRNSNSRGQRNSEQ